MEVREAIKLNPKEIADFKNLDYLLSMMSNSIETNLEADSTSLIDLSYSPKQITSTIQDILKNYENIDSYMKSLICIKSKAVMHCP